MILLEFENYFDLLDLDIENLNRKLLNTPPICFVSALLSISHKKIQTYGFFLRTLPYIPILPFYFFFPL